MYTVKINFNEYYFTTKEEAQSFANYWKVPFNA